MNRLAPHVLALAIAAALPAAARQSTSPPVLRPGMAVSTNFTCTADLGTGDRTRRRFCDIVIAQAVPEASLIVSLPPRRGIATLLLDLHNRFAVPPTGDRPVGEMFVRHSALVALVGPDSATLARAAVTREFRTVQDLFDQLSGGGLEGGFKTVAPGPAEPVRFDIPEGVSEVGLVGMRLEELTREGLEWFDAPGRPVALASNIRLEFTPP